MYLANQNLDQEKDSIVHMVDSLLSKAVNKNASDIHLEASQEHYRIRFRLDGILSTIDSIPPALSLRIISRIKIMSNLDISERRIPQDGHFSLKFEDLRSIDFRVSTCPTNYGEKVVIRILNPQIKSLHIDNLGFIDSQKEQFLQAIHKPQGMILVTGPTGSGKTSTLYTALSLLNTAWVNIVTAEDPIEIGIEGINQVNINPKIGLTFESLLQTFLRQDPDIIMVGEIRNLETAQTALKAAQTGHLVLSTVHTNSALQTVTRLLQMGIPAHVLDSSVSLIIAQRLVRKLCAFCKILQDDGSYQAWGCALCNQGFQGRIGLFEFLPMPNVKEDGLTILDSATGAIQNGLTTLEEVNRVLA